MINLFAGVAAPWSRPASGSGFRSNSLASQTGPDSQNNGPPALNRFFDRLGIEPEHYSPKSRSIPDEQEKHPEKQGRHSLDRSGADSQTGTADKMTNDYIYFIAALSQSGDFIPGDFAKRVEELTRSCTDPLRADDSPDGGDPVPPEWTLESFSLGFSSSREVALDVAVDSGGFSVSASAQSHFSASLHGEFVTTDGRRLSISASIQVDISVELALQARQADPLALDLNGDGELTFTDLEQGGFMPQTLFDLDADGFKDQVGFVSAPDGMLALDRNGNGTIDDGSELFGDQNGAANGFLELGKFDHDSNSIIDANDPIFEALKVFRRTKDGFETSPLSLYSIDRISLDFRSILLKTQNGATISQVGAFSVKGEERTAFDVLLPYKSTAVRA